MNKYVVSEEDREFIKEQYTLEELSPSAAEDNVFVFAKYFLGVEPFEWQSVFLREMEGSQFLAAVTPRQCGKTTAIAIHALWSALYNRKPKKEGYTHIAIISATEEQSQKVLNDIKNLMFIGDSTVRKLTNGKADKFFTSQLARKGSNKSRQKFKNGSEILCLPATDAVRGYSLSIVYVDEAAFLEDEHFLEEKIEPTIAFTKGKVILTTTPRGIGGAFYSLFDPDDKRNVHRYNRIWFGRESMVEEVLQRQLDVLKAEADAKGTLNNYYQEYEAEFTSSVDLFVSSAKVDACMDSDVYLHPDGVMFEKDAYETISIGVDFGMSVSKTVITVVSYNELDNKVRLLAQYAYEYGTDAFIVDDLVRVYHRFQADMLVIDFCPESYFATEQMRGRGLDPFEFKFRTMKIGAYNSLRQWINRGALVLPAEGVYDLTLELKSLREKQSNFTTKIEKPPGGSDDRADSLLLACYPFFEASEANMVPPEAWVI